MVWHAVDIPPKLDREISIFKAKQGLTSKEQAMIMALHRFFKLKADIIEDGEEVKINK